MNQKYAELNIENVIKAIKNNDYSDIVLPFNTKILGKPFSVRLSYTRGTYNYFNGEEFQRGFYIDVNNGSIGYASGETQLGGLGYSARVNTVKRYSKKQDRIAHQTWGDKFLKIIAVLKHEVAQKQTELYRELIGYLDDAREALADSKDNAVTKLAGLNDMNIPDTFLEDELKEIKVSYANGFGGIEFNTKNDAKISSKSISNVIDKVQAHYQKFLDTYENAETEAC